MITANATKSDTALNLANQPATALAEKLALAANVGINVPPNHSALKVSCAPEEFACPDADRITTVQTQNCAKRKSAKTPAKIQTLAAKTRCAKQRITEKCACARTATKVILIPNAQPTSALAMKSAKQTKNVELTGFVGIPA